MDYPFFEIVSVMTWILFISADDCRVYPLSCHGTADSPIDGSSLTANHSQYGLQDNTKVPQSQQSRYSLI